MLRIICVTFALLFTSTALHATEPVTKAPSLTIEQGALKVLYEEQLKAARVSGGFTFSYKLYKQATHCKVREIRKYSMRISCSGWPLRLEVGTPSEFATLLAKDEFVLVVRADARK